MGRLTLLLGLFMGLVLVSRFISSSPTDPLSRPKRLVGGSYVIDYEHLPLNSIVRFISIPSGHYCTASFVRISDQFSGFLLTSASCCESTSLFITTIVAHNKEAFFSLAQCFSHPDWNHSDPKRQVDLALVELVPLFGTGGMGHNLSKFDVLPMELKEEIRCYDKALLYGYGHMNEFGADAKALLTARLQRLEMRNKICTTKNDTMYLMLKSFGLGTGCVGDYGAPLLFKNKIVGIFHNMDISFPEPGRKCQVGQENRVTKLSVAKDWIQTTLGVAPI